MQISLLQACQLLEKPTLGTRLLGFQGCLQSSVRTPELLISFLGSYSNLASLLTTWFQFFSGLLIRIFSLNFLILFHFFSLLYPFLCGVCLATFLLAWFHCPVPYVWEGSSERENEKCMWGFSWMERYERSHLNFPVAYGQWSLPPLPPVCWPTTTKSLCCTQGSGPWSPAA